MKIVFAILIFYFAVICYGDARRGHWQELVGSLFVLVLIVLLWKFAERG